jgi:hypothetical protein
VVTASKTGQQETKRRAKQHMTQFGNIETKRVETMIDSTRENIKNVSESNNRWLERRLDVLPRIMEVEEFCDIVEDTPQFWIEDIDEAYREGFEEGFDYCVEQFEEMYRKRGFVRIREIANILIYWSDTVLRPWRYYGDGKHKNDMVHHPIHNHSETWSDIRKRILRRDKKCVRCGDVLRLEVDHIIDVQNGGRPTDDNLRTLCKVCHKGKSIWSD